MINCPYWQDYLEEEEYLDEDFYRQEAMEEEVE